MDKITIYCFNDNKLHYRNLHNEKVQAMVNIL